MEKGLDISVRLVMNWKFGNHSVEIKMFQMLHLRFITNKFNIYKTVQSCSTQKLGSTNVQLTRAYMEPYWGLVIKAVSFLLSV
jgi:hypothetical protein